MIIHTSSVTAVTVLAFIELLCVEVLLFFCVSVYVFGSESF